MPAKRRHRAGQRIASASVTTYPDTGQTKVWINWSDGSSTSGSPSSIHMQELIRRAEREGVRVKYGLFGNERARRAPRAHATTKRALVPGVKLKDRYSGGQVWLTVRDGMVVGAVGSDPKRYLGMTLDQAKHVARYGGSGTKRKAP